MAGVWYSGPRRTVRITSRLTEVTEYRDPGHDPRLTFAENPMKRVLLVIGDAVELLDTMYPYFRIQEDGHQVVVAAPEKRRYHMVQHEKPDDWDITQETAGYHLASDIAFRDIQPEEYAGIILSGGRAPEYLRYDEDLLRTVRYLYENGALPV
jgi:protease I